MAAGYRATRASSLFEEGHRRGVTWVGREVATAVNMTHKLRVTWEKRTLIEELSRSDRPVAISMIQESPAHCEWCHA